MRVAFLGLGIMGRPMAANLVKAGHEVTVWNRSTGKDVEGARSSPSPAEAARGAEVVWICVSDTKAVSNVMVYSSLRIAGVWTRKMSSSSASAEEICWGGEMLGEQAVAHQTVFLRGEHVRAQV